MFSHRKSSTCKLSTFVPQTLLVFFSALTIVGIPAPARAATRYVTTLANGNAGSLRSAIDKAQPGDTIKFNVTGTIKLAKELSIRKNLIITGPGARKLTISGGNACRLFHIEKVDPRPIVNISGLTIANGSAGGGAGLDNNGIVTLRDCTFSGNKAIQGGGIYNAKATLTIINCTFSGNAATSSGTLAGIGGGIHNEDGTVTLINSTFSGNSARFGGAIYNSEYGVAGEVSLTNCTLANNSATEAGGAIYNNFKTTLNNSIVAGNMASQGPNAFKTSRGTTTSGGYNIIGTTSGAGVAQTTGDRFNVNPQLKALGYYGGPTQTHALQSGSPAIDQGNSTQRTDQRGVARPQDHTSIANVSGGNGSDIGAFELNVSTAAASADSISSVPDNSNAPDAVDSCEGLHLTGEVVNCQSNGNKTAWTIRYTLKNCTGDRRSIKVQGYTNRWTDAISSASMDNPNVQASNGNFRVTAPNPRYSMRKIVWSLAVEDGEEATLTLTLVGPTGTSNQDLTGNWTAAESGSQVTAPAVRNGCPE